MIDELSTKELDKIEWDPRKAEDTICLQKRPDGNWRGFMTKNGKLHQHRDSDPQTLILALLTAS